MDKIDLFVILAFEDQTYTYMEVVKKMQQNQEKNIKTVESTLSWHYFMLSQFFNIHNFYEKKDEIEEYENAVIYHLPFGKDNIETGIEENLEKFKGKVPIVMRSYDPHSPLKTSIEYMDRYHDLTLTYLRKHVDLKKRIFANMDFDNHLAIQYPAIPHKRKFACMILRRETRKEYFVGDEEFKKKDLALTKTYGLREQIVQFDQIDVYGRNWPISMKNYRGQIHPHQKKYTVLNKYKFNFIVENALVDNFLSEKILDSFVSLSIPVYLGSPSVDEWIPKSCYVDIRDFEDYDTLISYLENLPETKYREYVESIKQNRDRIFNEFSTKNNFALPVYQWYQKNYNKTLSYSPDAFDKCEEIVHSLKVKSSTTTVENFVRLLKEQFFNFRKLTAKLG